MTPSVAEERARTLRERARGWREDGIITADAERAIAAELATPWRSYRPFAALLFFVLTALAVGALFGLLDLAGGPKMIAGLAALVVAEVLIAKRWYGTGIESGLWLAGLYALIFSLPGEGKPEALLLFAVASAVAGARVRNPFFGAIAAAFVIAYLGAKGWPFAALACGLAIAAVALAALAREWRRPSTEWLWIALLIASPVAGYFAADPSAEVAIAIFAVSAAVLIVAGVRMRHHAPLVAAGIALVIAGGAWFNRSRFAIELLLGISGAILLAAAFVLGRVLRDRTTGLVATPARLTRADDALQLVSVVAVAPHDTPEEPPSGRPQGEGGFGGAGATGDL